ncbi:carboxypeptidase-like regulatory domain-containing protein [Nitrosopumilus cobalaminigenes]|nr:carboxypeptidase-like regulatory domain-containing protein [Nitrosopumilus cobalaminigenes]
MYNKPVIIGLFSFLMIFSFAPSSQAELWEFVVELDMEKGVVYSGDTVVVTGRVVDHAYDPTRGVEVLIRTGADTTKAFTDTDGTFRGEFVDFERVPGTYTVNVIASWYGMTGLASTEFQVKGDSTPVSLLQQQLSTEQARKYLSSNESDFEKDPIGQTLFKYYHDLHDQLIAEKKEAAKPIAEQVLLEQQRRIAENLKNQAIEEYKPGYGTYGGYQYEDYIRGLNPEIRDLIIEQLDFTRSNFEEAQKIKNEILENGGTAEEARQAYLDRISIPKETLEKFNDEYLNEETEDETVDEVEDTTSEEE